MDVQNKYSFITNSLEFSEVGTKSAREYTVKGYISTNELDRANEVVTDECMKDMLLQIKAGNVKLDVEHSTFVGENDIPVGKIVDAGMDMKGLWVRAVINKGHEKFKSIWSSIQDGFLDAFSIAYKVKDSTREVVEGVQATILKSLELLNVAITGNPVNKGARMTESFYKSLRYTDMGETMINKEEVQIKDEAAPVAEAAVEPAEEVEAQTEEAPVAEAEPVVKQESVQEAVEEALVKPLDTIKSLSKEIVELKSSVTKLMKELEKPQLKGFASTDIAEVKEETVQMKSPMDAIN